jgi:predicted nucleotidyltransferase
MTKYPATPEEILPELVQDYQLLFGQDLVAIVLYGSAARGTYVPKKSDINILVVLTVPGIAAISKCFALMKKWQASAVAIPLVLTEEYIRTSVDSFPIEFLNLKNNYRVVYGLDVLASVTIPQDMLRLQCEAQIKGKLLHLRGEFLATLGDANKIKNLLTASVPAFVGVFNGLLMLKGVTPPQDKHKVFHLTAETYGLDRALLERVSMLVGNQEKMNDEEIVQLGEHYIAEIRKLAFTVDQIK